MKRFIFLTTSLLMAGISYAELSSGGGSGSETPTSVGTGTESSSPGTSLQSTGSGGAGSTSGGTVDGQSGELLDTSAAGTDRSATRDATGATGVFDDANTTARPPSSPADTGRNTD